MTNSNPIVPTGKRLARIDEEQCIGCTLCIKACPFDAIIGAAKHTHTVIFQYCTGCTLCLPPCPVDCIEMVANTHFDPAGTRTSAHRRRALKKAFAEFSRNNRKQRALRLARHEKERQELFERKKNKAPNRQT